MKILAIGNSFSQDATAYLKQIAAADGVDLYVANLFIGGCSLQTHWENIQADKKDYLLEINGASTDRYVSIAEALAMEDWDVITNQQCSQDSGMIETYEPYLTNILAYLKQKKPNAKYFLHETWSYETDSLHKNYGRYHWDQLEMYEKLSAAYKEEAKKHDLILIPCGDIIQKLRTKEPFLYGHGGMSLCRDGLHVNLIYGRYLLGAMWYKTIVGGKVTNNTYVPKCDFVPNAICDEKVLNVIKKAVDEF